MTERVETLGRPNHHRRRRLILGLGLVGATALIGLGGLWASNGGPNGTWYYSTAAPPQNYPGPTPHRATIASNSKDVSQASAKLTSAHPETAPAALPPSTPAQIAAASTAASLALPVSARPVVEKAAPDPIDEAKRMMADCEKRYQALRDYSCTFFKRERLSDGRMTRQNVMLMKARTEPASVYFKFLKPNAGREAIFVSGRNGDKALVHDVGIGKLLAGTLKLDPRSSMAMDGCRHPITEAGLGHMIDEITDRWAIELQPGESQVTIHHNAQVGTRTCTMIESKHPEYHPDYLFHMVKVYIDQEHHLPIRFEAYDWPRQGAAEAELVEEYTYMNLKTDLGLSDQDFDPNNTAYSFGRF